MSEDLMTLHKQTISLKQEKDFTFYTNKEIKN